MGSLLPPRRIGPAKALNPAAGDHVVTAEPHELSAARAAGEDALQRFPYLSARYAARGGAFTMSDGAWLVLLVERSPEHRRRDVDWLASVLLHRGMPRRLLEVYLPVLAATLSAAWPERAGEYRALAEEGERLADLRRVVLRDEAVLAVELAFAARAAPDAPFPPRGVGELLASAVADAACGLPAATEKLVPWLVDPARFTPAWIGAVHAAVAEARAALVE
ncbi:MAG: hypothetical protein QM704_05990 [Anaeromyxobacteraceae bacterium]